MKDELVKIATDLNLDLEATYIDPAALTALIGKSLIFGKDESARSEQLKPLLKEPAGLSCLSGSMSFLLMKHCRSKNLMCALDGVGFMDFMMLIRHAENLVSQIHDISRRYEQRETGINFPDVNTLIYDPKGFQSYWGPFVQAGIMPHIDSCTGLLESFQLTSIFARAHKFAGRSVSIISADGLVATIPAASIYEYRDVAHGVMSFRWSCPRSAFDEVNPAGAEASLRSAGFAVNQTELLSIECDSDHAFQFGAVIGPPNVLQPGLDHYVDLMSNV